uniref:Protein PIN-LIKES 6 n=1 Tax=Ananas comosus var. bracteatus TaxID=296719 RepID=A0A6V7QRR0_ANACO
MKEAQGGGGESLLSILTYSILPIAKVFTMCFMGFLMASKYVNVLPANGRKLLNGLVFSLLLPCLIFSDLGRAVTLQNLVRWWFLPVNVIMATISGSLIGLIVASIIRPPYPYFKFTIIHIGIGNTGNVPLVLIAALCRDQSNPFGDTAMCSQQGNAYISFGQWVGAIILYTYVFQMLAPPPGETFDSTDEAKLPTRTFQVPLLALEETQKIGPLSSKRVKIMDQLHLLVQKLKLKQIFQPPITAAILAIFIGCVPFLKNFVLTDDAPLFFFTDSCLILGEAMIPCILLALGGNLVEGPGPGSKRLGFRTIVAIIFARLVLIHPPPPVRNAHFCAFWCDCESTRVWKGVSSYFVLGTSLCDHLNDWMDHSVPVHAFLKDFIIELVLFCIGRRIRALRHRLVWFRI